MTASSTRITLAMLQFAQPAPAPGSPPTWTLWPGGRRLGHADLCAALETLPKPVFVGAHVEPGGITAMPLAAAAPEARAGLEYEWRNQGAYMREKLAAVRAGIAGAGANSVAVLLELEGEGIVVTSSELETWAQDYVLTSCGWTLANSGGDARAPVRLLLRRPDGTWSPGWPPEYRTPAP
jgi:hypothetical protein